ncbi:MAG: deoxyribonucleoside 5'-monophosphate N-glycosidase [Anaerolineae bacterium]|nr:deoxyribonucleoside 5'-monophosphate N-glycosidase [Anaerolineae bacterium]
MNIYFSCSITGGRADQAVYRLISDTLTTQGCQVPTAHLANADVMKYETAIAPDEVYRRDTAWVEGCDALIAEVSTPSHGVGYEIALALCLGKPVLCLYRQGRAVSKMILGNRHPLMRVHAYQEDQELINLLLGFLPQVNVMGDLSSQSGDLIQ